MKTLNCRKIVAVIAIASLVFSQLIPAGWADSFLPGQSRPQNSPVQNEVSVNDVQNAPPSADQALASQAPQSTTSQTSLDFLGNTGGISAPSIPNPVINAVNDAAQDIVAPGQGNSSVAQTEKTAVDAEVLAKAKRFLGENVETGFWTIESESMPDGIVGSSVGGASVSNFYNASGDFMGSYTTNPSIGPQDRPTWRDANGEIKFVEQSNSQQANIMPQHILAVTATPPTITIQPVGYLLENVKDNEYMILRVGASVPTGTLAYQWYKDGVIIAGANQNSYEILNTEDYKGGTYQCLVKQMDGTAVLSSTLSDASVIKSSSGTPDGYFWRVGADAMYRVANGNLYTWKNYSINGTLGTDEVWIPGFNNIRAKIATYFNPAIGTYTFDWTHHTASLTPIGGQPSSNTIPLTIQSLFEDRPLDNLSSAIAGKGPAHGSLTLQTNGKYTYTPDADYNGPDFYESNDGIVYLNVKAVDDPPRMVRPIGNISVNAGEGEIEIELPITDIDSPLITRSGAITVTATTTTGSNKTLFPARSQEATIPPWEVPGNPYLHLLPAYNSDGTPITGTVTITVSIYGKVLQTFTVTVNGKKNAAYNNTAIVFDRSAFNLMEDQNGPVDVGGSQTWTVNLSDAANVINGTHLAYQWYDNNGNAIAGATRKSYTISPAKIEDAGQYRCKVTRLTNGDNTVLNEQYTHYVHVIVTQPTITTQPVGWVVDEGGSNSLTVVAKDIAGTTRTYQWYRNGEMIDNESARRASYAVPSANLADAGTYTCRVTWKSPDGNIVRASMSSGAVVTVTAKAPTISTQPVGSTVDYQGSKTLTVVADGTGLTYQWYRNGVIIDNPNARSANYVISPATLENEGQYKCIVKRPTGSQITSRTVSVTITPAITITTGARVVEGDSKTLSVTANVPASTNLMYQWYDNHGNAIAGATNASYTISSAQLTAEGSYRCLVQRMSADGHTVLSSKSASVYISITAKAPTIKTQPVGGSVVVGGIMSPLKVEADPIAGSTFTYQWYKNGKAITGATNASYGISPATLDKAGTYTCLVKRIQDITKKVLSSILSSAAVVTVTANVHGASLINGSASVLSR